MKNIIKILIVSCIVIGAGIQIASIRGVIDTLLAIKITTSLGILSVVLAVIYILIHEKEAIIDKF